MIAFRGSAIWHCRRRAAGAINIYLKMNDFNSDPLGEDPVTDARRSATLAALEGGVQLVASLGPGHPGARLVATGAAWS